MEKVKQHKLFLYYYFNYFYVLKYRNVHKETLGVVYIYWLSLLHGAELNSYDQLSFGRHVLKHVGFESPQHVWSEQVVQFLNLVLFRDVSELL